MVQFQIVKNKKPWLNFSNHLKVKKMSPSSIIETPTSSLPLHPFFQKKKKKATIDCNAIVPVVEVPKFDADQLGVIENDSAKYLVVQAPPGGGKTLVLTFRAKKIIETNPNACLLLVTFSRDATREIQERLQKYGVEKRYDVKTIHAFALSICRKYGAKGKTYISTKESIIKEMKEQLEKKNVTLTETVEKYVDWAQDEYAREVSANEFATSDYKAALTIYEEIAKSMLTLSTLMREACYILTSNHQGSRDFYQQHYSDVLIDEFQDTSTVQYKFMKMIIGEKTRFSVFGDPHQAIYSFLGAQEKIFDKIMEDFPSATILKLRRNYRSMKSIVLASNRFMKTSTENSIETDSQDAITLNNFSTRDGEFQYIANQIQILNNKGVSYNDIAILMRRSTNTSELESILKNKKIPISKNAKDDTRVMLNLMKLICDGVEIKDEQFTKSMKWIIKHFIYFKGIGEKSFEKYLQYLKDQETSSTKVSTKGKAPKKDKLEKFIRFFTVINELAAGLANTTFLKLAETIQKKFNWDDPLIIDGLGLNDELVTSDLIDSLISFNDETYNNSSDGKGIHICTVHRAKGREWKHVFVPEVQDGVMPLIKKSDPIQLKKQQIVHEGEEDRIFYVAITRAKEWLYLTNNSSSNSSTFIERLKPHETKQ